MYSCTVDDLDSTYMYMYETLGLSMEIFKYEYNLSRKNIKNNKPIYTLKLFKDFVIFVRDSQISTQIDLPANYCSH